MEKKNVPKIRFPGFTEPWEQRKLEEIANIYDGVHQTPEYQESGIMFLSVENITTLKSEKYISEEAFKRDYKVYPKKGDILMTRIGDVGTPNVVETTDKLAFYVSLALLKPINVDSYFLCNSIQTSFFQKGLRDRTLVTAVPQKINKDEIGKVDVILPKELDEQKKLGVFFRKLDNLISLHQRKLENLKKQKKGLLQKMFPEKGKKVPEIRFPEFTDDWEQRKLGEISDKVTEKNINNTYNETFTNSAEYGIIPQRDFFEKDISNIKNLNGYYVVRNDDFVYNPRISNFAPVGPIKRNKLLKTGVMSPLYYVFRTRDIDRTYLEHYFDTTYWHMFMKLNGDSGARSDRFAIKDSVFVEMPIPFPKLEEQKKIGMFFEEFDNLITLHQRKLEHLQKQKKALLQQMFV